MRDQELSVRAELALLTCPEGADDAFRDTHPNPVFVTTTSIRDDRLSIGVQFAGGCDTHAFSLCWGGDATAFLESEPVQVELRLQHETNDTCEALLSESLTFDLRSLEHTYASAYAGFGAGDELVLRIGEERVSYAMDGAAAESDGAKSCVTGGCNRELCGESGTADELATACVVLPEYACLAEAVCERQSDGRCGWTYTKEALECLSRL